MTEALIGALCAHSSRLDQWARDTMSGIDAIDRIELTPQPAGSHGPGLSLSFSGWSPSLHAAWSVAYRPTPTDAGDQEAATDAMIEAFGDVVRRQRLRARDADVLGHVGPLRNGMVGHLHIDRAIAAVYMAAGEHREIVEFARSTIGSIHGGSTTNHAGGATLGRPGQMVGESIRADGTVLRYVGPQVKIYPGGGRWPAVFTGHHLRIPADRLPETVLGALVGRPVSALVEVHPEIDGRTMRMAENDERGKAATILVGVDQVLDPLADIAA